MNPRSLTAPLRSITRSLPLRPTSSAAPIASRLSVISRPYSESSKSSEESFHAQEDKRITELEAAKKEADKKASEFEEQVKELKKEMQYLRADIQTATRRTAEEKAKASEFAITSFARALLSTAENLTSALKHVPHPIPAENKALADLHQGVELTHKALLKTFEQHGVTRVDKLLGEQFDPNMHEAVFTIPKEAAPPKKDGGVHGPGEIMDVSKEGWMIGNRVLRPAQVGVVNPE
ncbi:hypothetical protein CI109_106897 [Kwoniella shandongensis]|uniref:GrpE protein homolog, mitochondrial n=1 Tax=Kwoniella shandongensis TaxID=1734106 RepID=A0A5M6C6A2_9TREE|nr:uncharacterized protein CI109_000847 [Kwoniella shandongensis]KAA5530667.1 hypothetical protein CI109_000847 [Kwoniella shandongensis]